MLRYHDQYKVFTDNGLQAWQQFVIERAVGHAQKKRNTESLPIGKAARSELDALQVANDTALISADVSCGLLPNRHEVCSNGHLRETA